MSRSAEHADVLARLVESARRRVSTAPDVPDADGQVDDPDLMVAFLGRYLAESDPDELASRSADDLLGVALAHWRLGRVRAPGQTIVHVVSPERDTDGWGSEHSVLLVVSDDAPFLVDTVRMALDRVGVATHLMVHPMLAVKRDADHTVVDVPTHGGRVEAWTMIEIDRCPSALADRVVDEVTSSIADAHLAVSDFDAMRGRMVDLAKDLERLPPDGVPPEIVEAVVKMLGWLTRRHFVFLGAASYDQGEDGSLVVLEGSQLGLLSRSDAQADPPPMSHQHLLAVSRADGMVHVHRPARPTCIAVRRFDSSGNVTGEHRFIGLFSAAAYRESVLAIPYVRERVDAVIHRAGFPVDSHSGRSLRTVLETFPRDDLFEIGRDELYDVARRIVALQDRQIVRVIVLPETAGPWATVLVYLPRSRFDAQLQKQVAAQVAAAFDATAHDSDSFVGTSALARISVLVRRADAAVSPDIEDLEQRIDGLTTPWSERVRDALVAQLGEAAGLSLHESLVPVVPAAYSAVVLPEDAVADLVTIAGLPNGGLTTTFAPHADGPATEWRFRVFRSGEQITLTEMLPLLQHLGLHVLDERPVAFHLEDSVVHLYDIGVCLPADVLVDGELDENRRAEVQRTFVDLFLGEVESDGFNQLVLAAGLTGRQVAVLRSYAKYLRQIGFPFSQQYLEEALVRHPTLAVGLVRLFAARFDPDVAGDRDAAAQEHRAAVLATLDAVPSLDDDRIGRALLALIDATLRTNAYRPVGDEPGGAHRPVLSFKLDPSRVPDLPAPRPMYEIWVCAPRVEGVHLRGGRIARGGIRWSDRREDFRTEVLGLVKAQMVKNAVIIPVGAKGGFVVKQPPADPAALRAEVVARYSDFIAGLLDVTDNIVGGDIVAPPDVVRYDDDDPYLVVAADKGTASFSDTANAISARYGFWLGDAFASGGSAGYDHKAMGITARGAWESVKRHAHVLGKDADRDVLTVVGIGDMSGDVFGNGLLRSPHVQLVAAFDHRHIFLDPDPDPAASFAERQRLFDLPRSSWADYDSGLVSAGGQVVPRSAKQVDLSPEVRARLGIEAETLTPNELMSAILRAPVDLLWNGGIGTYVKASTEAHHEVGDRANDALRVDGRDLRCKIVGEGGNLGFTQRGRIEFATSGGLINTDAIDNSAGVDCSDHEVNIKILLAAAIESGDLDVADRDELLESMTDEVGELVLDDNRAQTLALTIARRQSQPMVHVHRRYLDLLEAEGWLDRGLEFLPSDKVLAERQSAGAGLTTPEFAVLLAYTKTADIAEVLRTDLPDDPYLRPELVRYFPTALRERFAEGIDQHRLRREIVATQLVNQMVNTSGISFDHRLTEETGAPVVDICRAWVVARDLLGSDVLWDEVEALGSSVKLEVQIELFLELRRMVERCSLWLLRHRRPPVDITAAIGELRPGMTELSAAMHDVLTGPLAALAQSTEASRLVMGVPEGLAQRSSMWPVMNTALDMVELARVSSRSAAQVAAVYWRLFDTLDVVWLWDGIGGLDRSDRWQSQARSALRDDLLTTLADLTADALAGAPGADDAATTVDRWLERNERSVARMRAMHAEIVGSGGLDLTTLSVGLRQLRNVVLTSITA
jgi:glutamate dehydrogenase